MKQLKVGIIGAGRIGSLHAKSICYNVPTAKVVGITDVFAENAKKVADELGIEKVYADYKEMLADPEVEAVLVCSSTDTHADIAIEAAKAGKHIFCEKPVDLTPSKVEAVIAAVKEAGVKLQVGFNRRFAPTALRIKENLAEDVPTATVFRVNAGAIPGNSWIQDPVIGGGRVLGEVCHFVDFATWIAGAAPKTVYAVAARDSNGLNDTLSIQLGHKNGSISTVCYFANGSKALAKERFEVFQAGQTGILDDFRTARFVGKDGITLKTGGVQDKGQKGMLRAFFDALKAGRPSPIADDEIFDVTLATFAVLDSLREGRAVSLEQASETTR